MLMVRVFLMCFAILLAKPVLATEGSNQERNLVVFLFDVSDSVTLKDRGNYFKNFQQVLKSMNAGDEFVVLKIGENSQLLNPIASGILPYMEKGMASGYYESEKRKVLGIAKKQVGKFLNDTKDHRTSIISSFIAVNDYFANKNGKKTVFVFSDMIEASSYLNMEKSGSYQVKKYVDLNPNYLDGAQIYIVGVNTGEKNFAKVKNFWTGFYGQYDAKVIYYQYSLTNFTFN